MKRRRISMLLAAVSAGVALGASPADATTVQDLVRVKGHERNTLVGLGIVVGLNGTGDQSKDSLVAARPYEQLLKNLGNPVESVEELARADSYALVQVTMELPPEGVRSGDLLDVSVSALFNAESLEGGELVVCPLRVPLPEAGLRPLAFANGAVVIEGSNPRRGRVRDGGQMVVDVRNTVITSAGTMTLVLKDQYAGYPVATMIASTLNQEFALAGLSEIAVVEDAKNILVLVPRDPAIRPADFIAALLTIPVDPSLIQTEARVVINEAQGIILVTGDVQVGPVLITHKDLTITSVTPERPPTPDDPRIEVRRWVGMDTTADRGSTRLADLLQAFDQLDVIVEDQIAIVHELKRTGALHAEIVTR
ncbi:MAG: flagellar basal body P-ring protein FlgI [Planctomycetota bacterium]|jgi:flagellar P-ring protein precursor FlgI